MQEAPFWAWIVFGVLAGVLLALDLFSHYGGARESRKSSIAWSVAWLAVGLSFTLFVWQAFNATTAHEYLAAYLIEKALSLDNLFVFLVIFSSLRIPLQFQRTALSWGIFGALVFRAIFIFLGAAALQRWDWVSYVFAAVLFYAAYHAVRENPQEQRESGTVAWLSKRLPISGKTNTTKFFVRDDNRRMATPLLVAVVAIELTDIVFAIDSVPAALSVSREEFVVYSSNVFAILGLRALYIVLADVLRRLRYLHYGLAAVLAFAGVKMLAHDWVEIPPLISVGIILALLAFPIYWSLRAGTREVEAAEET